MAESHDDMIVSLMAMGFELQDCQDAINFGKANVEAAVEWIVAGKPGLATGPIAPAPEQSGASLKLRSVASEFGQSSSVPFQKPHPIPEPNTNVAPPSANEDQSTAASTGQSDASKSDMDQSEEKIISRMHMSDSQRKYKERFEQKKIDEAKKQAVLEKKRQKEEHARILKEIAEDREKKKLLSQTVTQAGTTSTSGESQATSQSASSSSTCLLQIRLPDGRSLRHSFSSNVKLQEVWNFTAQHQNSMDSYVFIQPFPRHEFTQEEMSKTVSDLRLTPSGSLVLQKKQTHTETPVTTVPIQETVRPASETPPEPSSPTLVLPRAPPAHAADRGHNWGQGFALEGDNQPQQVAQEEEAMEEDDDEDNEEDFIPYHGGIGQAGLGIGGMGRGGIGRGGMGRGGIGRGGFAGHQLPPPLGNIMGRGHDIFGMQVGGQQQAFGGEGQRLVGMGDPEYQENYQNRPARELALERAQARLAQPVVDPAGRQQSPGPQTSHSQQHVISLLLYCLKHITNRLNDPRHQLLSLGGISEDMAQIILDYLIKEKQLKPKALNAFIPCYLRKLVLDCYPYATNELLHSIRLHTNLLHLSLSSCPLITDQGIQGLNTLKKMKRLNLSCCQQLTNKCLVVLENMKSLVWLNLEQTGVTDSGVIQYLQTCPTQLLNLILNRTAVSQAIFPHIHQCANQLKSLSLEDTKVVSLSGIESCLDLESLNVARTGIVTESLMCLRSHPNLVSLNIANTENVNGDSALHSLKDLKLQTLVLPSRHTTTDAGIQCLSDFPLTSLDLTNYIYVTDEAMVTISKITSLKKLLLTNTKLTDEGMLYLENLKHLEVLHLDRTLITDEGAKVIGALTNLLDLSMSSTRVTTKFLLSKMCNNCTNLAKLNLSKTTVTNKGVLTLELPFLQMLNLDGTKVTPDLTAAMATGCPKLTQISMRNLEPFTRDDELEEAEMDIN